MDYKGWLQSKTIWSLLVAMLAWSLQHFASTKGIDPSSLLNTILTALQVAGAGGIVYGRWTATTPLTIAPLTKTTASLLMCCVLLVGMTGCAAEPTKVYGTATTSLTVSEQALKSMVDNHQLTRAQQQAILPYLEAVHAADVSYHTAVETGNGATIQAAATTFQAAVTGYNNQVNAAKAAAGIK